MLIGIISDTHDRHPQYETALQFFANNQVSLVVHCGDWKTPQTMEHFARLAAQHALPVRGVLGNNDVSVQSFLACSKQAPGDFEVSEGIIEITIDSKRFAAYHGHHIPTRKRLLQHAAYDALFLGHSHKPLITKEQDMLTVNPGSTAFAIPRSSSFRPSVALLSVPTMQAEIHYLD